MSEEKKKVRKPAGKAAPKKAEKAEKPARSVKKAGASAKRSKPIKAAFKKEDVFPGSSGSAPKFPEPETPAIIAAEGSNKELARDPLANLSPLERKLADPVLPELPREDRARLQMQSPTRLYFYWSIKHNPFKTLNRAFGDATGSYALVVKLVDHTHGTEEIYRVEPEGSWWFNVEPDSLYRAEVGFYAPNRPYIRIVFSNYVRTPRRSPSRRTEYVPHFTVSANEFAQVLDASGYSRDAYEVALAGDDRETADSRAREALSGLLGRAGFDLSGYDGDDLRFILLAIASGYSFAELKGQISERLFEKLSESGAKFSGEQALAALQDNFEVETDEIPEEEEIGPAVFGLSAVNFPRRIKTRRVPTKLLNKLSKFDTVSSSR
ncbi:MAG: DUF4912 domain-containing protein [Acidobacteriota bacterium]|nr:MAG: DUF4912 domain-containing protein [Acidobacteriota bacterium]